MQCRKYNVYLFFGVDMWMNMFEYVDLILDVFLVFQSVEQLWGLDWMGDLWPQWGAKSKSDERIMERLLLTLLDYDYDSLWSLFLYFNRLAPVSRRPGPPMHRSTWCNPWQSLVCCFPLQKFFTSFFVHHPSRIKNPRNQKHPQFHPVIHGNTRLRHPILFLFVPALTKLNP